MYHIFSIHSSVGGHHVCFQFLVITNNTAMNMVEQMSLLYECVSFGYIPKSGIAGFCGRLIPIFLRIHQNDFQSGCKIWDSHLQWRSDLLLKREIL
ncbi:hypothetical protein I79_002234 [Cricetulus griseus]|uniref:Uncharacterized protein n=1 Tax=Cricetulus griseus TaxID=10029 RepID=G3GWV1_CRIGR|nr:hypothetical protein I79_002234 [Cricetulus griseus]